MPDYSTRDDEEFPIGIRIVSNGYVMMIKDQEYVFNCIEDLNLYLMCELKKYDKKGSF